MSAVGVTCSFVLWRTTGLFWLSPYETLCLWLQIAHANNLEKLSVEKEQLALDMNKDQQEMTTKLQEISALAQQTVALQEQTQDFSLSDSMTESRTAYALSLYSKISNISWDYAVTGEGEGGRLAGCEYKLGRAQDTPPLYHTTTKIQCNTIQYNTM